jgi:hypothetical protein
MNISWHETSGSRGASAKSSIQGRSRDGKAKQLRVGNVQQVEFHAGKALADPSLGNITLALAINLLALG